MAGIIREDTVCSRDASIYRHTPLPDPSTHIRLLELVDPETWEQDGKQCRLAIWPLKEAPAYHAISYTWGNPAPTHRVPVDGSDLRIPKNTSDVLDQLAYFRTSRYYWIDAICIAQGDIAEKNDQVAIMGEVYKGAAQVMVCLDRVDDKAEVAMRMAAEIEARCPTGPLGRDPDYFYASEAMEAEIPGYLVKRLYTCSAVLGPRSIDLILGLSDLCRRPWFKRVWVVQELLLAASACVYCGMTWLPAAILDSYVRLAAWLEESLRGLRGRGQEGLSAWLGKFAAFLFARHRLETAAIQGARYLLEQYIYSQSREQTEHLSGAPGFDPIEAVLLADDRLCADRRDAVYGVLSLIDWEGAPPLKADYDKPAFDIALEYLHRCDNGMASRMAATLISNLGISVEDGEVQRRIEVRTSRLTVKTIDERTPASAYTTVRLEELDDSEIYGMQFTAGSFRRLAPWTFGTSYGAGSREVVVVATDVQPGDWVIFDHSTSGERPPLCGFIVRPREGVLDVLHHAFVMRVPLLDACQRFQILLDPEDFVLWTCILEAVGYNFLPRASKLDLQSERTRRLLRTPVSGRAGSSVAVFGSARD